MHIEGARGLSLYMRGRFREALEALDSSLATVGQNRIQNSAAGGNVRLFAVFACFFTGRLREEARRAALLLREVENRGDFYTAVCLRSTVMVDICLAADDPDGARRHLREAMARWTKSGFNVQHWYAMLSETNIELYVGDGARALARLERDAPALKKSFLLHSRFIEGFTAYCTSVRRRRVHRRGPGVAACAGQRSAPPCSAARSSARGVEPGPRFAGARGGRERRGRPRRSARRPARSPRAERRRRHGPARLGRPPPAGIAARRGRGSRARRAVRTGDDRRGRTSSGPHGGHALARTVVPVSRGHRPAAPATREGDTGPNPVVSGISPSRPMSTAPVGAVAFPGGAE